MMKRYYKNVNGKQLLFGFIKTSGAIYMCLADRAFDLATAKKIHSWLGQMIQMEESRKLAQRKMKYAGRKIPNAVCTQCYRKKRLENMSFSKYGGTCDKCLGG